jgi:hypothetical protein
MGLTLQQKIERNRLRQARFRKAEQLLRKMRQRIFDYEDHDNAHGTTKLAKCQRIMDRCKRILQPLWQAHHDAHTKATTDRMMRTYE